MTTIQFIGLFVLTFTTSGFDVLMPQFNMQPKHDRVIAYRQTDRLAGENGGNWEVAGTFVRDGVTFAYVEVNREAINILGAEGPAPQPVEVPHLSCCCIPMRGVKPAYKDRDINEDLKRGAQITVNHGTSSLVQSNPDGPLQTQVAMNTIGTAGITIEGTNKDKPSKTIILKADALVLFGNTPLAVLEGTYDGPPDDEHFKLYYEMGVNAEECTAIPSTDPLCASSPGACTTENAGAMLTKARTAKAKAKKRVPGTILLIDIDCSNSQWP